MQVLLKLLQVHMSLHKRMKTQRHDESRNDGKYSGDKETVKSRCDRGLGQGEDVAGSHCRMGLFARISFGLIHLWWQERLPPATQSAPFM